MYKCINFYISPGVWPFNTCSDDVVLNIGTCRQIWYIQLDSCLSFIHVESSNLESYVCIKVRIFIASICQTIWTHYVVSELKNVVKLIENIYAYDTWRHEKLSDREWLHVILYILWIVSFKLLWRLILRKWSKNNCLFLPITWQNIRSLEWSSAAICRYPTLARLFFSPTFLLLRALNLRHHLRNWNHFKNIFFLFPPLNHMSTFFISLTFIFFLDLF